MRVVEYQTRSQLVTVLLLLKILVYRYQHPEFCLWLFVVIRDC